MPIFKPMPGKDYEWINCVNGGDYEIFTSLDGSPRAGHWEPVMVRRVRADERQGFQPSDFPWLGSDALVMRISAVDSLRYILSDAGEILPLVTEDGTELFVLNVTRILDAIDEEYSEIIRYPDSNRIMRIKTIAFVESVVRGVDIFRLSHQGSPTYVSERFVEAVDAARLKGLEFVNVWGQRSP